MTNVNWSLLENFEMRQRQKMFTQWTTAAKNVLKQQEQCALELGKRAGSERQMLENSI